MHEVSFMVKYQIGEEVYLRSDNMGEPQIIVGYHVMPGNVMYIIEGGGSETEVCEFQLLPQKRVEGVEYN